MKGLGAAAASVAAIMLSGTGGVYAADLATLPVKALPATGPTVCTSIVDFFTTACQLSAYGVRFYGTIDVGGTYQTNGANMAPQMGDSYLIGKSNFGSKFQVAPNAMSPSNIGLQIKEPLGGSWSFVGQVETDFNPFSGDILDGPASIRTGIGVPLLQQDAITSSNFNGQFYNGLGFAGFSNPVWGTLTFGRQNSLGGDQVLSYDPQASAAAFSTLGLIGSWAGGGDTENRKDTTALKYRNSIANWHYAAYAQLGGYAQGNASTGAYYGNVGSDWHIGPGVLSADVTGGYRQNAYGEPFAGIVGPVDADGNPVAPATNTAEKVSVSINNTSQVMASAKYQWDRFKLYLGYDRNQFYHGDDFPSCFTDISGLSVGCGSTTVLAPTSGPGLLDNRVTQLVWFGGRYAVTDALQLSAGYYHFWQNQFTNNVNPGPGQATSATCAAHPSASLQCSGTQDVASFLVDWKFAPKWDTYIGTTYTTQNGGLVSGYLAHNDWTTTGGVRFRW